MDRLLAGRTGRTLGWLFAVHWERPARGAARGLILEVAVVAVDSCYSRSTGDDGRRRWVAVAVARACAGVVMVGGNRRWERRTQRYEEREVAGEGIEQSIEAEVGVTSGSE